ncbi:hypothetical protein, partial [Nonomuraea sp. NPDC052265]|uniref:hypothetical protein n=1 Tax=Nonomuraea sp. NPDC052265 TaxID=3364374 RepID=UPI0037CC07CC
MKPPAVAGVNPARGDPTSRALCLDRDGSRGDLHPGGTVLNLIDMHALQMRRKKNKTAGFRVCRSMQHNDPHGRSLMIGFSTNQIITKRPPSRTACYRIAITSTVAGRVALRHRSTTFDPDP